MGFWPSRPANLSADNYLNPTAPTKNKKHDGDSHILLMCLNYLLTAHVGAEWLLANLLHFLGVLLFGATESPNNHIMAIATDDDVGNRMSSCRAPCKARKAKGTRSTAILAMFFSGMFYQNTQSSFLKLR
jgi:hypothetical protein